jgi:hypothetical protein
MEIAMSQLPSAKESSLNGFLDNGRIMQVAKLHQSIKPDWNNLDLIGGLTLKNGIQRY